MWNKSWWMLREKSTEIQSYSRILTSHWLQWMDLLNRKSTRKQALTNTLVQIDLIDIFRTFQPQTAEYMYFSSIHRMFSKIDQFLGNKTSLMKLKKTEIIWSIFSDHNTVKLQVKPKKNTEKYTKSWKLSNMLLNNEWVNNKIKEEIKRWPGNKWKWDQNNP